MGGKYNLMVKRAEDQRNRRALLRTYRAFGPILSIDNFEIEFVLLRVEFFS